MAEYEKKVREILMQNGCYFLRHGKGDHDIWHNPIRYKFSFLKFEELQNA